MSISRPFFRIWLLISNIALWQRQRKFAKIVMTASHKASFFGYPEIEAVRLLKELLDKPAAYNTYLESFVSRVTCRLAWGTPVASDELKQRARELLIGVSPTGSVLNRLPFLMLLPHWMSPAKAWEQRRARTEQAFFLQMQAEVRARLVDSPPVAMSGAGEKSQVEDPEPASWTQMFLRSARGPNGATFHGIPTDLEGAYAVGMHGIAGALTIAAPMQGFCLALCLYPQYLAPLHAELDRVCPLAPPTLSNMPDMPYLRACIRETLRWRPPVPTGIPHQLTQDDTYRGFHLPAKSIIHPLEWSMCRDPRRYPRPHAFDPGRWLDPASPVYELPLTRFPTITGFSQFGFGRRICQGQGVAEADLFVGLGSLAWAFNIRKARDAHTGLEIPVPEMDYSELLIAKPKWFHFDLCVRNEERRTWINHRYGELRADGHFPPERVYWDAKNTKLGWGRV